MGKTKKHVHPRPPAQVWPGMSRQRFDELCRWLRATADRVGLRDWKFEVAHCPLGVDDKGLAEITCVYGRKLATIRLAADFAERDRDEQREALLHELLHCHLDAVELPVRNGGAAWRLLGDSAGDVLHTQIRTAVEHAVDAISHEMAGYFPKP